MANFTLFISCLWEGCSKSNASFFIIQSDDLVNRAVLAESSHWQPIIFIVSFQRTTKWQFGKMVSDWKAETCHWILLCWKKCSHCHSSMIYELLCRQYAGVMCFNRSNNANDKQHSIQLSTHKMKECLYQLTSAFHRWNIDNMDNIFWQLYHHQRGVISVMVIVVRNEISNPSSNPELCYKFFCFWERHEFICPLFS